MNSDNFKGFIYEDGTIENFAWEIEHVTRIHELDKRIKNGCIRMCCAVDVCTIGITVYELTSEIHNKILHYLRRHRLLNESIGIEIEKDESYRYFDNYKQLNTRI